MDCVECQTEPLTPRHYCQCCGRKLSLEERRASETAPVTIEAENNAATHKAASRARCESCGGPTADGNLCQACEDAFAPFVGSTALPAASRNSITASAGVEGDARDAAPDVAWLPPVIPETAPMMSSQPEIKVDPAKTAAARAESARAVAASVVADRIAAAKNAAIKSEKISYVTAPNPAAASNDSSARSQRTRWLMLAGAAIVILAAVTVSQGAKTLGIRWPLQTARDGQPGLPAPAAEAVTAAALETMPSGAHSPAKAASTSASSAAPPQTAASARLKPTTTAPRKPARQPNPSAREVAPVVAPAPAMRASSPVAAPPPKASAESPRSVEAAVPIGRFFEPADVDESPKIATRVEPQLPADVSSHRLSDVVVVRVLVSQSGRPFRVSLLRGSKQGRSMDAAVVAAVNQWTFSPARKRGEAVSCWYNIGVPLSRAD